TWLRQGNRQSLCDRSGNLPAPVSSVGRRQHDTQRRLKSPPLIEKDHLLKEDSAVIPSQNLSKEIKDEYVNITLEQTASPHLTIQGSQLRNAYGAYSDGDAVTCLTTVKGTSGFSSGQHYREVSLGGEDPNVPLKESWWVGVTSRAVLPQVSNFWPTTLNGCWFLSSSPDGLQFNTEPSVSPPVSSRPQTVGVFLDHDHGELSFYNVEEGCLISSLTTTFKGDIFPLFNPGKGD
uniref:B30.2/SPRY domain-containing protein n=1 Tax=Gasterosteus aculeatus aculeatus TaxID=481459 RepID=A0AAQ4Q687_GASAC